MLLGTSIGAGPYAVANSLPSPALKVARRENAGFGKLCLLDKEICAFMEETKFTQDQEIGKPIIKPGEENNTVEQDYKKNWEEFLKPRADDFCGFGFLAYKKHRKNPPKVNVNNLEECHKTVVERVKKKLEEEEKERQEQSQEESQ